MDKQNAYELGYKVGMQKSAQNGANDSIDKYYAAQKDRRRELFSTLAGGGAGISISLLLKHILESGKEKEKSSYLPWILGGGIGGAGLGAVSGLSR